MKKNLNKIGYTVEVMFDRNWKVVVKYTDKEQYFYIFNTEEEAIEKFNKML